MSLEAVLTLLRSIADQLENLWIQRDVFGETLFKAGFTPDQIKRISDEALADPERRKRSRAAYSQMRESLEEAGRSALLEALAEQPPPSGEPN